MSEETDPLEGWAVLKGWKYIDGLWQPNSGLMYETEEIAARAAERFQREMPSRAFKILPWAEVEQFIHSELRRVAGNVDTATVHDTREEVCPGV